MMRMRYAKFGLKFLEAEQPTKDWHALLPEPVEEEQEEQALAILQVLSICYNEGRIAETELRISRLTRSMRYLN